MNETTGPVVLSTGQDGIAVLRLGREHGNAINGAMVEALLAAYDRARSDVSVRGLLLAATGKIFCPGLDLQDLILLDRPGMRAFLRRFNDCLLAMFSFPKPVVAAIHGHALAGGCVFSLTADWRVAKRGALIGLNEVKVGVPLPFGVSLLLRESVRREKLEEIALLGRNYSDEEALEAGLVHEVAGPEEFEARCRARLEEILYKAPGALEITKRHLRSAAVERMRHRDPIHEEEWLDVWFSPGTRARIEEIVAGLRRKGG